MVSTCCAVGCKNRKTGPNIDMPFYGIPGKKTPFAQRRRTDWINAIKRGDWKNWTYDQITRATICGDHFIGGIRSECPDDPNWAPTIFAHISTQALEKLAQRKRRRERCKYLREKREKKRAAVNMDKLIYNCSQCEKVFPEIHLLTLHYKIHTAETPCACQACEKCFIQASNLQTNIKLHSGKKGKESTDMRSEHNFNPIEIKPFAITVDTVCNVSVEDTHGVDVKVETKDSKQNFIGTVAMVNHINPLNMVSIVDDKSIKQEKLMIKVKQEINKEYSTIFKADTDTVNVNTVKVEDVKVEPLAIEEYTYI